MIEAVPELLAVGVKVAVRVRPVPLMAERVPPETDTSPEEPFQAKELPGSSEKVKVMLAVSPAFSDALSVVIARVGAVESIVTEAVEAPLRLPAPSTV